jgi:hypothetical protein
MVYDANKRLMADQVINKTQASITFALDLSIYSRGIYIIEMLAPDGKTKTTTKISKM